MSIDYTLAKELKDAGFPGSDIWKDYGTFLAPSIGEGPEVVPTLSELIEACGKDFYSVNQNETADGKGWSAESWGMGDIQTGSTPEEAVARLWLALNKQV